MCLSNFFTIFKKDEKKVVYQELSNIYDETYEFNILKCSYMWANNIAIKHDISKVKIGKDRLIFSNDEFFKFDYMLRFMHRSKNMLTIVALGFVNDSNQLTKADAKCAINLKFTSDNNITQFLTDLHKHILIYKRYDTYDKSVKKFKNFNR